MIIKSRGVYTGPGLETDFVYLGIACVFLSQHKWFIENVQEWLWICNDFGKSKNDYRVEDLLEEDDFYKIGFKQFITHLR